MKRILSYSVSAALLFSFALPVVAMQNTDAVANRISRRLLEDKTKAEQRVPVGEIEAAILLRERKEAAVNTSGFSNLGRSRILTRIRTLRGSRLQNIEGTRPSRRSILDNADSLLVLPPTLVQTGGAEAETVSQKLTRRTLVDLTEIANRVVVGQ